MPVKGQIRGAFVLDHTLADRTITEHLLERAAAVGVNTILTEVYTLPPWLAQACHDRGLRLVAGVACFSDHAFPEPAPARLRPIDDQGRARGAMEWYTGLIPTDVEYNTDLVRRCVERVTQNDVDGLALDFIRWPLHWELELRDAGRDRIRPYSFDPITLRDFTARTGLDVDPDNPKSSSAVILRDHVAEWLDYRCQVITDVVEDIAQAVRSCRPDLWLGAFVVPEPELSRRELVGQALPDLATSLDAVLPMTYHAILETGPDLVAATVNGMRANTDRDVIPVLQTSAAPELAGDADWGPEFGADDLAKAVRYAVEAADGQFVLFPSEGMDDARWEVIGSVTAADDQRQLN